MEHYSIRKTRPDVERQNIIKGLERFQEVCVDGTPTDCKAFFLTEPGQYACAILIFTRAGDTGLAMTQSLMIYSCLNISGSNFTHLSYMTQSRHWEMFNS